MSAFRRAAIIAVGSELLTPTRLDTNSLFITETLNALGMEVRFKSVVGDDREELASHLAFALPQVDLLVTSGGLGPTDDDVTREVVAQHLGRALSEDDQITESIRRRFAARGWQMPEINRRQAMVPEGAVVLPNPNGSAPGLWIEERDKAILLLPGPPREMKPMLLHVVDQHLRGRTSGALILRRVISIAGRSESRVDEVAQPIYSRWRAQQPSIETTILAASGIIELHLSARGADVEVLTAALEAAVAEIQRAMPEDVFSVDGASLERVVGSLLTTRGWWVALAESCTGGLVTSRLTDVPGASGYVNRTIVAYSNTAKTELLDVSEDLLRAHGAVSEPVALAMAQGVRAHAGVQVGIGITGIAGPGGGTAEKPVGTVCIAVVAPDRSVVRSFVFPGDRQMVKTFAAVNALDLTRRLLVRDAE